jgi:hypothetical protein
MTSMELRGVGFIVMLGWAFAECKQRTAISKSTIFSANVDISLLKQNEYSPMLCAVKTKSP